MRKRRFPREPICPEFKIAIAFDIPIDLIIGLGKVDTYRTSYWALKKSGVIEMSENQPLGLHFPHQDVPEWTLS